MNEYETSLIGDHELRYSASWINNLEQEIHFVWYHQQASMVYKHCLRDYQLLEVGIGNGLLSDLLRRRGWKITTLDIDAKKRPDVVCSASDYDYREAKIETALAFEVFEHIPVPLLENTLRQMHQAEVQQILFSVPWNERPIARISLKLPKIKPREQTWWVKLGKITTPTHFWELSKQSRKLSSGKILLSVQDLSTIFRRCGFGVQLSDRINYVQFMRATRL